MLQNLLTSLNRYETIEVVLELAIIWAGVYLAFRFLRGTRGANLIKGFVVLLVLLTLIIRVLGQADAFSRLNFIYDRFLGLVAILLIVVFQPELRQAMIRLGHARIFRGSSRQIHRIADEVAAAVEFLSKSQFGALIAIERHVGLRGLVEGGQRMDAVVSTRLLESIFWPNSPLHDLGVVIKGDRIIAANVQFPLAEEGTLPVHLGSRHRAAVGLTLESDCLVVIVSEETGAISIAENGTMHANLPRDEFRDLLAYHLSSGEATNADHSAESDPGEMDSSNRSPDSAGEDAHDGPEAMLKEPGDQHSSQSESAAGDLSRFKRTERSEAGT